MRRKMLWGVCSMMALLLVGCGSSTNAGQEIQQSTPEPTVAAVTQQQNEDYHVEGSTVYVDKSCYLPDVKADNATEMVIADGVELKDYEPASTKDECGSFVQPQYNSWFAGSPKVKSISLEKADVTVGKKSKAYVENGLLLYKGEAKGVYACVPATEGKVKIPQGIKDIYDCAFYGCQKITSVALPESVRWIGGAAFGEASRLESIEVSMNNPFLKSEDGVLYTKDGLVLLAYPAGKPDKYYKVKDGVKFIAGGAFAGADNLEEIELPRGVFSVEEYAFKGCRHLNKISGASRIYSVKETAYEYCEELDTIDRPLMDGELANGLMPIWEENYMKNELSYVFDALPWKFSRANQGYITREDITRGLKLSGLKVPKRLKKKIDKVTYSYEMQILTDLTQNSVSWVDFDTKMDNFLQRYGR